MRHEFLESVPLYALGVLNGAEKAKLEEHLKSGCDICEPELLLFQENTSRLPYALPNKPLPADLKEKIWNKLQTDRITPQHVEMPVSVPRARSIWIPLAVAAVITVLAIGLWRFRSEVSQQDQEILALQKHLERQKKEIAWLRDPSVQLAMLTGLDAAPNAKGRMLWNPSESRGIFYANALPPLSPERSYQLWVIGDKGPVSAGIFSTNQQGSAVVTITQIEGSAQGTLQFAVTIEPRGGVPQPTGSMVLAGKPL